MSTTQYTLFMRLNHAVNGPDKTTVPVEPYILVDCNTQSFHRTQSTTEYQTMNFSTSQLA